MKRLTSILFVGFIIYQTFLLPARSDVVITIDDAHKKFSFKNGSIAIADDMEFTLIANPGGQLIGPGSNGGPSYGRTLVATDGKSAVFDTGPNGDQGKGVGPGASYDVGFEGWATGTMFDVVYTAFGGKLGDISVAALGLDAPVDMHVLPNAIPVPEPSTVLVLGIGMLVIVCYARCNQEG